MTDDLTIREVQQSIAFIGLGIEAFKAMHDKMVTTPLDQRAYDAALDHGTIAVKKLSALLEQAQGGK